MSEEIVKSNVQIILPDEQAVQQFAPRRWKSIKFMLAVRNDRQPLGRQTLQTVVGRCLGERNDGQCFWVGVDLPWVSGGKFRWQRNAKKRLDTFLNSDCTCSASGSEVKYCDFHIKILYDWKREDDEVNRVTREEVDKEFLSQPIPGPIMERRVLHLDFPWVKQDVKMGTIVCEMCNAVETPFPENSSWRNVFIQKHSACGFPAADYAKSLAETNLRMWSDVLRELKKKRLSVQQSAMTLDVLLHYCDQMGIGYLPEVMSLDEACEFIRKDIEKRGSLPMALEGKLCP